MSSAGGDSVRWFGLIDLPDLVTREALTFEMLRTLHHWLAWTRIAVLALHVAAVAYHDLFRRDGVFRRMSPFAR
jgi:cytochrome b561